MTNWVQIFIALILLIGLFVWLERSRFGLAARSVREDEVAAEQAFDFKLD